MPLCCYYAPSYCALVVAVAVTCCVFVSYSSTNSSADSSFMLIAFQVFSLLPSTRKLKCYDSSGSTSVRVRWGEHHGASVRCDSRTAHDGDCTNQEWDVGARVA
ncbi:hypothetical protein BDZ89DRAFT_1045513 [Hymenopellis radicata]|nr:hypothetical protein BDZ89DRAFT_1045513 [Hymenopellis radicata]